MGDSNDKKMLKSDQSKICTLPDAVLYHILSFLDMKEVVPTSLLSRRWRYLWISVPILNFSDTLWIKDFKSITIRQRRSMSFVSFVDRVLLLHDDSNISRLQVTSSSYCNSKRIDTWLAVAARRKFHDIHLELFVHQTMDLPHLLFSSSITVLKLDGDVCYLNDDSVAIPSWVCFSPLLKTLVLRYVKLPYGNSDNELVFSNPALENLTLKDFEQSHLNVLNISTYRLKNLVLDNFNPDFVEGCQNKIYAPNLKTIYMGGYWYYNCCFGDLSHLVSAKFDFRGLPVNPQYLANVLECVSCSTTIELSGGVEFVDENWLDELSQSYTNIRCLKFCEWGARSTYSQESDRFLLNLLKIFPCVEAFYLDDYDTNELEEECLLLPETFHHLKYVEIGSLKVSGNELKFLKLLLKSAIVLEKLVIVMDTSSSGLEPKQSDLKTKHDFGDKIHSLARASPRLTVLLL